MRKATAELILKDPDRFAHHDRVFLNNPVVMQGMGLAPLVVLATTAHNGVMLAAAVTLLLVPSRVLACLLSRLFPLNSENPAPEELQKKLLPRALVYSLSAAVVYLVAYPIRTHPVLTSPSTAARLSAPTPSSATDSAVASGAYSFVMNSRLNLFFMQRQVFPPKRLPVVTVEISDASRTICL